MKVSIVLTVVPPSDNSECYEASAPSVGPQTQIPE